MSLSDLSWGGIVGTIFASFAQRDANNIGDSIKNITLYGLIGMGSGILFSHACHTDNDSTTS